MSDNQGQLRTKMKRLMKEYYRKKGFESAEQNTVGLWSWGKELRKGWWS
jgi:hypothetical protein